MDNLIIIAAGGGNDIFSSICFINSHIDVNKYKNIVLISILGLTPFHTDKNIMNNDVNTEDPIIIPSRHLRRYIVLEESGILLPKEIYCAESLISDMIDEFCPCINNYACVSPKYKSDVQANNLQKLFLQWHCYDHDTSILLVDFGGDILTDGNQSEIISPELDAFSLSIVRFLPNYRSSIVVCFPGVDGELDHKYLRSMCINSMRSEINPHKWKENLSNIFNKIKHIRPGNTIPNMIRVVDNLILSDNNTDKDSKLDVMIGEDSIKSIEINKHFVINGDKQFIRFDHKIDMSLQKYIHYFDVNINNPFTDIFYSDDYDLLYLFNSIMSIYSLQKETPYTNWLTDLHLQYLRPDLDNKYTNKHLIMNSARDSILLNVIPYRLKNVINPNQL